MSGGLSRTMVNLAEDTDNISGGTPEKGAEINAAADLVDVNAFRGVRRAIDGITDAVVGRTAFSPTPGSRR